jgi:hypothetical protein
MKQQPRSWTFINQSDPSHTIVVHDAHSAECLQELIKHHDDWILKDEPKAAPPPIPAPTTQAPEVHMSSPSAPPPLSQKPIPQTKPVPDRRYQGSDRRIQQRFATEFRVVLITGAHSYRNTSEDVSMGGMKLKKAVPHAFISQKCTIFVSHPDLRENVQISCKVLADPSDPRRIQFTETDQIQLKRLEEWLAESTLRNQGVA